MNNLLLFILGAFFIIIILPIIQTISDICVTFGQWILSILNVKVTKNNIKVEDLNNSIEPTSAQAIGFQVPYEEDYDDEDEPDNKMNSKNKNKVGF